MFGFEGASYKNHVAFSWTASSPVDRFILLDRLRRFCTVVTSASHVCAVFKVLVENP